MHDATTRYRGRLARETGQLGSALRASARQLERQSNAFSKPLHQLAEVCEDIASQVSVRSPARWLASVRDFGRRHPGVSLGVGVGLGLVLARSLRSEVIAQYPSQRGASRDAENAGAPDYGSSEGVERLPPSVAVDSAPAREYMPSNEGEPAPHPPYVPTHVEGKVGGSEGR